MGNQFLSHIRDVDAVIHVIRLFKGDNIIHVEGKSSAEIEIIETKLLIRDIVTIKTYRKTKNTVRAGDRESKEKLIDFAEKRGKKKKIMLCRMEM